jgi:hypothetical protein
MGAVNGNRRGAVEEGIGEDVFTFITSIPGPDDDDGGGGGEDEEAGGFESVSPRSTRSASGSAGFCCCSEAFEGGGDGESEDTEGLALGRGGSRSLELRSQPRKNDGTRHAGAVRASTGGSGLAGTCGCILGLVVGMNGSARALDGGAGARSRT